jgi:hypothetical protein
MDGSVAHVRFYDRAGSSVAISFKAVRARWTPRVVVGLGTTRP